MSCQTSQVICLSSDSSGGCRVSRGDACTFDANLAVYHQCLGPTWAKSSCPFRGRLRFPSYVSVDQAALLVLVSRLFLLYT